MPPLPGPKPVSSLSGVPVINTSGKYNGKGKGPVRHPPRRQYGDEPLPVRLSDTAPRKARIVGREQEHAGGLVSYQLQIGDVRLSDIGVDEVLDYVSPLELEQFEIIRFREDGEILKVLEQDRELERKAKLARQAERAWNRVAVCVEENSDSEALAALIAPEPKVQTGKHGRARPNYSKFYKPARGKGREVVPRGIQDDSMQTSDHEASVSGRDEQPDMAKRRRRRRDPITNELMPLPPLPEAKVEVGQQVRRRRKRHPVTNELMPIGWKYDPEQERRASEMRRAGMGSARKDTSFKRLSISDQHDAKRPRLDTESVRSDSASLVPTKAEITSKAVAQNTAKGGALTASIIDLMSSDEEPPARTPKSGIKAPAKQVGNSMMKGTVDSTATTSAEESSPEPVMVSTTITKPAIMSPSASQRTPKAPQTTTSILSPSAVRASSTDPLAIGAEETASDSEVDEDEWLIESILTHRMSDPKTHPPELGKEPVMLYSVKWDGFEQPTWEPMESFGDRSFVDEYREKVGLSPLPKDDSDDEMDGDDDPNVASDKHRTAASESHDKSAAESEEEEDEDEYELERIVTHHLSDPRTHPKAMGKTPVMLYQVRWKGWEEMTWEPEESFEDDPAPLFAYKRRHGLK